MAVGDPGVRTAPAFTATATDRIITLHLVDTSGDLWSQSFRVPVAATAANIEALAAAYAAASQASLWNITDQQIREGASNPANANNDERSSGAQGVNQLFHNLTTHLSVTNRVIAPILGVMQGDTDIPLVASTELLAISGAFATLNSGFALDSTQYTERRERKNNPRIRT